jgi:hypothetical protein
MSESLAEVTVTRDEARELTDRIRGELRIAADLVIEAYKTGAWAALGYGTWQAYCVTEFAATRWARAIPVPERREITQRARSAGMSQRAIGAALGVDRSTVQEDLAAGGGNPPPDNVIGIDGKRYDARSRRSTAAVEERWARAAELAGSGMTSASIAREIGLTLPGFKAGAKRRGIKVKADEAMARRHQTRLDPAVVVPRAIETLEQLAGVLAATVEANDIDSQQATVWTYHLTAAVRKVQKAVKTMKEEKR